MTSKGLELLGRFEFTTWRTTSCLGKWFLFHFLRSEIWSELVLSGKCTSPTSPTWSRNGPMCFAKGLPSPVRFETCLQSGSLCSHVFKSKACDGGSTKFESWWNNLKHFGIFMTASLMQDWSTKSSTYLGRPLATKGVWWVSQRRAKQPQSVCIDN